MQNLHKAKTLITQNFIFLSRYLLRTLKLPLEITQIEVNKKIMSDEEKPTTTTTEKTKNNRREEKPPREEDYNNGSDREEDEDTTTDAIRKFFASKLNLGHEREEVKKQKVIEDLTFDGLMKHWKDKGFKNIITMVGAGISTSAGIPDFRSPGSGLYDNLQKYNLPYPSAIFEMNYFKKNPQAFFALAKELYPGNFNPTPSHYFVRLLHKKGLLLRHYTQNIDTLERVADIPDEKLVEAHGTFYTNHCLGCRKAFAMEWMKEQIFSDKLPVCDKCKNIVKPDIVFFGENLPEKFYTLPQIDFNKCDLLIIMGTSLEVQPFAGLIDKVKPNCMRLLINRTKVGNDSGFGSWFMSSPSLLIDSENNTRDVAFIGDCDDGVMALTDALGWGVEFRELIKNEKERLQNENKKQTDKATTSSAKTKEQKTNKEHKNNEDKKNDK